MTAALLIAPLMACIALAARAVWRRSRPGLCARIGRDVLHGDPRPAPPVVRPENPMRDTLIIARPLWWDATERKEY